MKIWILEISRSIRSGQEVNQGQGEKGSGFIRFKNICSVTERMRHIIVGFMADGVGTASGSSTQSRRHCSSGSGSLVGLALALKPVRGLRAFTTVGLPCGPSN